MKPRRFQFGPAVGPDRTHFSLWAPGAHGVTLEIEGREPLAMASQTGGKAFSINRPEDLESVFKEIAAELQAQYLFGYYVNDNSAAGGFKKITVRAPGRPDLRIRARQGYYPAAKP